MVKSWPVYSQV